ncbi:MAG: hypothetical protein CBE00_14190 [Planctomycetaceae bacterium TMED240]|nr:MAG: hypothetical protein CBE00_14190 [Planctomycetaceae bacterium TMED240]
MVGIPEGKSLTIAAFCSDEVCECVGSGKVRLRKIAISSTMHGTRFVRVNSFMMRIENRQTDYS